MPKPSPVSRFARSAVVVALMLVTAACTTRSDRTTLLPVVPTSLVPNGPNDVGTGRCTFAVGQGEGALVNDVLPTGAAAGVLAVGDVVTAADGAMIRTSADLVAAVQQRRVGDVITLSGERDGRPLSVAVTLGESGDAAGRPMLGVLVTTLEERRQPAEFAAQSIAVPLARVVSIAGELWVLDPTGVTWSPLGVAAPADGALIPSASEVYTVEVSAAGTSLVAAISGERVPVDLANWRAVSIMGHLGGKVLLGAERTDPAGVTEYAVIAVDPVGGAALWFWSTDPASARPVPVGGYSNVTGDRVLVALSDAERTAAPLWVLLSESGDAAAAAVAAGIPPDIVMVGWHDAEHLLAISGAVDQAILIDPVTGTAVETTLPVDTPAVRIWAVGDGAHVLVEDGEGLVLAAVGGIERRQLTASCEPAFVSELGWSSD